MIIFFFSLRKICKELKELREKKIVNYELFSGSNTLPPCSNSNSCLAGTAAAVSLDETSKTFPTKRGEGNKIGVTQERWEGKGGGVESLYLEAFITFFVTCLPIAINFMTIPV